MTGTRQNPVLPTATVVSPSRRWWVLVSLVLVVIVFDLNLTMINVALPTLATELHATSTHLQWFSGAFSLMVSAALLPAGFLGDRYGPKRPLLIALAVLGATALLCTQASTPGQLIAGQLVLGASAGFIPALSLALLNMTFPDHQLGRALAIWSVGMTAGIPLGPIIGGYLTNTFGWTAIFLLNVPLVVIGAIMLAMLLPEMRGRNMPRLDVIGSLTSIAGIVLLTYGLTSAGQSGWNSTGTMLTFASGVALIAVFVLWIRRSQHPFIDPALFRPRSFRGGVMLSTLVTFTLMGAVFTVPQYFHVVHDADPMATGLGLMPIVGGLLAGIIATDFVRRFVTQHALIAIGFGLLTVATLLGASTSVHDNYVFAGMWLAVAGIGIGFTMPQTIAMAMNAIPEHHNGMGSAVLQTVRQVGGTFGIALLGTLLAGVYRSTVDVSRLSSQDIELVQSTAASGMALALHTGDAALLESVRHAFVHGMSTTLWVSAGIAIVGCVMALVLPRDQTS